MEEANKNLVFSSGSILLSIATYLDKYETDDLRLVSKEISKILFRGIYMKNYFFHVKLLPKTFDSSCINKIITRGINPSIFQRFTNVTHLKLINVKSGQNVEN